MYSRINTGYSSRMTPESYLHSLLAPLVGTSEQLSIVNSNDDLGVLLTVSLNKEDMGRVIGKGGATIKAARTLLRVFGMQRKMTISVKVLEPQP